ncbi:hypothetical protein SLE2022_067340 [Rubroshorea leprosula]
MRAGACSAQQTLTADAATTVKHAVSLAKRRGHAQVTPLHVASSMLAASSGLLRKACLQSHSHPLQFRALELCFNVALNRLPASSSSPLLGPHSHHPSLSNALVAAFKRAQAHQRRGSIENQQQPILAIKIELESLIISILDDPSVSRVMREAGFSSTQVKNKVEQAVSFEISSHGTPPAACQTKESPKLQLLGANLSQSSLYTQFGLSISKPLDHVRNEDVTNVLNGIVNKRRNTVIIGECLATAEAVVRGVMDKFEKGQVPGDLRYVQFINLPLFSLRNLPKDEVEQKLVELRCLVKNYMDRGVVLYLGDLKLVSEFWSPYGERGNYYCPVEHVIMELKRIVCGIRETAGKMFLMGIATSQTYMRCKAGNSSLETIWELHPVTISADNLSLSLTLDRDDQRTASSLQIKESTTTIFSASSSLPPWLQQHKEESRRNTANDQEFVTVKDLYKKRNSYGSVHTHYYNAEEPLDISLSPSSSTSASSQDHNKNFHQTQLGTWPVIFEPKHPPKEHQFLMFERSDEGHEVQVRNDPKPDLLSNPNSSPNSASTSEAVEEDVDKLYGFKEVNAENMSILCNALEKKVPWQKKVIPGLVSTLLECRSGASKSKSWIKHREQKEETWIFFSGADSEAKQKIARELARLVFGSQSSFVSIGMSNFSSSTRADAHDEESNKKRMRDERDGGYLERFGEALNENPHRVFLMEDLDQVDTYSQKGIKQAMESGKVTLPCGDSTVPLKDAIIIFSCESFSSVSRPCSPHRRQKVDEAQEKDSKEHMEEKGPGASLDLNIAIEDECGNEGSFGDIGMLESVDGQINFRVQKQYERSV